MSFASSLTDSNSKCPWRLRGRTWGAGGVDWCSLWGSLWGGGPRLATRALPFIGRAFPGGLSTGKTRGLMGELAWPDGTWVGSLDT